MFSFFQMGWSFSDSRFVLIRVHVGACVPSITLERCSRLLFIVKSGLNSQFRKYVSQNDQRRYRGRDESDGLQSKTATTISSSAVVLWMFCNAVILNCDHVENVDSYHDRTPCSSPLRSPRLSLTLHGFPSTFTPCMADTCRLAKAPIYIYFF